jgi:HAD superfamily hydrolase (TIGR01549 family)
VSRAILFDVDGTLVDSNDAHAHAWVQAFADAGITVDFGQVRRCIGMGGDKLMPDVSGVEEETPKGQAISKRRREIFRSAWLPRLQPFRDADRLAAALHARGYTLVAASSAKRDELKPLLDIAGVTPHFDGATSSDDAEESKPDPDIVNAALKRAKVRSDQAIMVGDTPYDLAAARRAGVPLIAFRCGGWGDLELQGAIAIYDGPWDMLEAVKAGRAPLELAG